MPGHYCGRKLRNSEKRSVFLTSGDVHAVQKKKENGEVGTFGRELYGKEEGGKKEKEKRICD